MSSGQAELATVVTRREMSEQRRAYLRAYQLEWLQRRRREWLSDKACVSCGSRENLEVDHIDPTTKVSHRIWSWRAERREAELAKCQVLCRECHHWKTGDERRVPTRHGTEHMYNHYGCRCEPCRAAKRNRQQSYVRKPRVWDADAAQLVGEGRRFLQEFAR